MARPRKGTVDYFPHYVKPGKTLFILESEFGNDGYSFWFKLLETLGSTDGMAFDWNNTINRRFFLSKAKVSEETALRIIQLLAEVEAIDRELWELRGVLWSQNLVDNVRDAFKKRTSALPQRPEITDEPEQLSLDIDVFAPETPSKAVNPATETGKVKRKESKEKESKSFAEFVSMTEVEYQKLVAEHGEAKTKRMIEVLNNYKGSNGKRYKSDYLAIRSWVIDRVNNETQRRSPPRQIDQNEKLMREIREGMAHDSDRSETTLLDHQQLLPELPD